MFGFQATFLTRKEEVESYLDLISAVEDQLRLGVPKFGADGPAISSLQQRILYANVYLHLYNMVEATVSQCLDEICTALLNLPEGRLVKELTEPWRREWVRFTARTHVNLAPDRRLETTLEMAQELVDEMMISDLRIEAGGGGNWDDSVIEDVAKRVGCELDIEEGTKRKAKRHIRDEMGPLALVKNLRNRLAHGSMSFGECGATTSAADLRHTAEAVVGYLSEVVDSFSSFLEREGYLTASVAQPEAV